MNFLKKELLVWRHYRLRKKKKIRVLFLFADSEVWSMANLYRKLQEDGRFEPVIGVLPYFHLDRTITCAPDKYKKSVLFCKKNHFQYVRLYKEKSGRFLSIGRYKPDVVCFNSPMYLAGIEEAFQFCRTHNIKTFFVSYGYFLSHGVDAIFNSPFQNGMDWLFWESRPTLEMSEKYSDNHGKNAYFLGYPKLDNFFDGRLSEKAWKKQPAAKKKVIWAPHHSIDPDPDSYYDLSCFCELADTMLELADKYHDKIQFAFRPHPLLKSRLTADSRWGKEKTQAYFAEWEKRENTQFSEGNYIDLFLSSDAMIGDSISFTCEYTAINKPYLYTARRPSVSEKFNDLGKLVLKELLYQAPPTAERIEHFLETVVLKEQDPLKEKRRTFSRNNLLAPNGKSASENIFEFLKKELLK